MTLIKDSLGNTVEMRTVQYDLQTGEFVILELDGSEIVYYNPFTNDETYRDEIDFFKEEGLAGEFRAIPKSVLNNPKEVVEDILAGVMNNRHSPPIHYEPYEITFAIRAVNIQNRNLDRI